MKSKLTRTLALVLTLCLLLSCSAILSACNGIGGLKLESIAPVAKTYVTEYTVGDEVNFKNIEISVRYNDRTQNVRAHFDQLKFEYDGKELTDLNVLTETAGDKTVTVLYYDEIATKEWQKTTITIHVSEKIVPEFVSMTVKEGSVDTAFCVGDEVDFSGIQVEVRYRNVDPDTKIVGAADLELEYAADLTATVGEKTVTVKYNDTVADNETKTTTFTVAVGNPTVKSFAPVAGTYAAVVGVGESYDWSEFRAELTYEEGNSYGRELSASDLTMTFADGENIAQLTAAEGEKLVTATYTDVYGHKVSMTFTVTVELRFVSISVVAGSVVTDYYQFDAYDFSGIQAEVRYNNASYNVTVGAEDLTLIGTEKLTDELGEKTVTVRYADPRFEDAVRETSFKVSVAAPGFLGITANTENVKLTYKLNLDTIDFTGLTFTVDYEDDDKDKTIAYTDASLTFSTEGLLTTAGEHDVEFTFSDEFGTIKTVAVRITVVAPTYDAANTAADTTGLKTEYYVSDTLADLSGVSVGVRYSDSAYDVVLSGAALTVDTSAVDMTKAGEYSVRVSFTDPVLSSSHTVSFVVKVTAPTLVSAVLNGVPGYVKPGDTPDLSGVTIVLTYDPAAYSKTLTAAEITLPTVDTAAAGTKTVAFGYADPYTGKAGSLSAQIVVSAGSVIVFSTPANYTASQNVKTNAGKAAYGEEAFEGQFFAGRDTAFYVGDDNEFRFRPTVVLRDGAGNTIDGSSLVQSTEITMDGTALTARAGGATGTTEYYSGETLIVTANNVKGSYQFTAEAVGHTFTLSVTPLSTLYTYSYSPVTAEIRVVDGYNVYTARDLSVIDNTDGRNHNWNENGYADWKDFKEDIGYTGVKANAVIFQSDITLTIDDIPDGFKVASTKEITLKDNTVIPTGSQFLYDGADIFQRQLAENEQYVIYGNYFTLSAESFPTVPSTGMKDAFAGDVTYGGDFSNTALFRFYGVEGKDGASVTINNLSFKGNANRNEKTDKDGYLVSAGGLILEKNSSCTLTFENTISKCFFLNYFPDDDNSPTKAVTIVDHSKCFDSYQNASFVWGYAELQVKDSYIQRAGGPLVILQHVRPTETARIPNMVAENSVLESYVNGNELWFTAVGASTLAPQIKMMSDVLAQSKYGFGSYTNGESKMNMIALIMSNGSNAAETVGSFATQGKVSITTANGTTVLNRNTDTVLGQSIYAAGTGIYQQASAIAPFFNVGDGTDANSLLFVNIDKDNNRYLISPDQLQQSTPMPIEALGRVDLYKSQYAASDHIAMNHGGFGLMFSFTH